MTWPGYLMSYHTEGWYPFKVKCLDLSQIESGHSFGGSLDLVEERCGVPGIGFMPQSNLVMAMLTVGHWLVVSILILMNIALWWFHRKPKGVTPCKS